MQALKNEMLGRVNLHLLFYLRYVDDVITVVPITLVDIIFEQFNSYHRRLQLTIEIGNKKINFLDMTIIIVCACVRTYVRACVRVIMR